MAARLCEEKSSITARLCWKRSKESTFDLFRFLNFSNPFVLDAPVFVYKMATLEEESLMKKIVTTSILAVLTIAMLLPVAGRVNAGTNPQPICRQSLPGGNGGGH